MWKVDLHNHLGKKKIELGFDETIDFVNNKLGENFMLGIVNSEDYRFESFVEQRRGEYDREFLEQGRAIYIPSKKMFVVKCQEIFSNQGHILAIGLPYNENVKSKEITDVIKETKDLGALLCAVHPFYYKGIGNFLKSNQELLLDFSSIETYNGSAEFSFLNVLPKHANYQAQAFFHLMNYNNDELDLGMSAFTGGHSIETIGTCYTRLNFQFDQEKDKDFVTSLDKALREVKSTDHLKTQPNIKDAVNYSFNKGLINLRSGKFF